MLRTDRLRDKVRRGGVAVGTWVTIGHPEVAEVLSSLPFDWLVVDMEHAPLEVGDVELLLMAMDDVVPLVRVPWNDPVTIKRVLDVGAEGVVVPLVNSGREAEAAVKAARYPPRGVRGFGPRRAARYGLVDPAQYYREADKVMVIAQVETEEAVGRVEEILAVDGVDGVFVGPNDLSASMGAPRDFRSPRFVAALERVVSAARAAGKIAGIMTYSPEDAAEKARMGFNFIALASDLAYMVRGFREALRALGLA